MSRAAVARIQPDQVEDLHDRLDGMADQLERIENAVRDRSKLSHIEPWLTRVELAEHLGVSKRWIEDRIAEGVPHRMIAGKRMFRLSMVEPWLRGRGLLEGC